MRFQLATLLLCVNSLFADSITQDDAHKILKNFLDYHVDQKEIDQKLFEKIKKNFVSMFDSEKIYLLDSEVYK